MKSASLSLMRGALICAAILSAVSTLLGAYTASAAAERVDERVRLSLQLDPSVAKGSKIYRQYCIGCHRRGASGDPQQSIPALAGQREAYLIKQLADFAELEREADAMHAVLSRPALDEPQAWADLAAYLGQLPATRRLQIGDGNHAELGAVIFQEQCVDCHESDARGDDEGFIPSLRDQHYSYLLAQLRSLAVSHRRNVDPEFMAFIGRMQASEIEGLADYLSRLHRATRDRTKLRDDGTLRN